MYNSELVLVLAAWLFSFLTTRRKSMAVDCIPSWPDNLFNDLFLGHAYASMLLMDRNVAGNLRARSYHNQSARSLQKLSPWHSIPLIIQSNIRCNGQTGIAKALVSPVGRVMNAFHPSRNSPIDLPGSGVAQSYPSSWTAYVMELSTASLRMKLENNFAPLLDGLWKTGFLLKQC